MKTKRVLLICITIAVLMLAFAGCGSGGDTSGQNTDVQADPVEAEPEVVEQEVTEQIAEAANTEAGVDEFEGSWVGVDDASLFVNITKDGDQYKYEDNDGAYQAAFADGILKVTVAENDTADVYVDKDTGHLVLTYMDSIIEYARK